jgi:hypothetical protein
MYDTLKPELLTATEAQRSYMRADPTAVVSSDIFEANQFPYMELRRPFILAMGTGLWKPTIAHLYVITSVVQTNSDIIGTGSAGELRCSGSSLQRNDFLVQKWILVPVRVTETVCLIVQK